MIGEFYTTWDRTIGVHSAAFDKVVPHIAP